MHHTNKKTRVALLTISDTRSLETDKSGELIETLLSKAGHTITGRLLVKDDITAIQAAIKTLEYEEPFAIITTGGTGLAKRDFTFEALKSYIKQDIPGFGELFRMLSYQEVGSRAMASRAFAGFSENGNLFFCLPGSVNACQTAMEKLIISELPHLIYELEK